jgi:hypothetical protein
LRSCIVASIDIRFWANLTPFSPHPPRQVTEPVHGGPTYALFAPAPAVDPAALLSVSG